MSEQRQDGAALDQPTDFVTRLLTAIAMPHDIDADVVRFRATGTERALVQFTSGVWKLVREAEAERSRLREENARLSSLVTRLTCQRTWEGKVVMQAGDRVRCHVPGSWVDGREGIILRLNVRSSDGIEGCLLQMDGCTTVVPEHSLQRVTLKEEE